MTADPTRVRDGSTVTGAGDNAKTESSAPRPRLRLAGLDGLRGVACACIVVLHVSERYSPTVMATYKINVTGQAMIVFFALSGFLLYLPYIQMVVKDPDSAKLPDTRSFALHRFLRVFPGYLVIFLICCFVLRVVYVQNASIQPVGTVRGTGVIVKPLELIANLTLVQTYIPQYFQTGISPSWSLTLEFVFYLSLPLFGLLMLRLRRRSSVSPLMLATIGPLVLLAISVVGKIVSPLIQRHYGVYDPLLAEWGPNWVAVWNRSFLSLADNFTFGMLAAVIFVAISTGKLHGHLSKRLRWYCAAALVVAGMLSLALLALRSHFVFTALSLVAGLMVLFIVAPIARGEESKFAELMDWVPFKYLGLVSLSLYLWHFPVIVLFGRFGWMAGDTVPGLCRNIALVLAVSVLAASVTYRFVEKPALTLAKRYRPASK
jgi:peptidoglycan/LPS O-acetylase OafA/YrhL